MLLVPRRSNFDLFDDFFNDDFFTTRKETALMKTNIKEKKDKYVIEMDLPGYEKENIDLKLENGYLTVSAESKNEINEDEEGYIHQEKYYGSASRSFYVGDEVTEEDISAEFKNGVLLIDVPKKEEEKKLAEPKKINIK